MKQELIKIISPYIRRHIYPYDEETLKRKTIKELLSLLKQLLEYYQEVWDDFAAEH